DAALAGRAMARDRGLRFEVVVGEEVTTLGGHLLALWIEQPIRPFRSLRSTIAAIHDQSGIAIPAHPLVPYPLCAQGFVLRRQLRKYGRDMRANVGGRLRGDGTRRELGYDRELRAEAEAEADAAAAREQRREEAS